ncbi:MAG: hypothetical protein R6U66_01905 [Bacteroidales bacterium]
MNDLQLEEYRRLTIEINNNAKRVFQLLSIVIPLSSGLLALPLSFEDINGLWILLPNLVLIPSLFLISSQFKSVTRIATYIACFYEGHITGIYWESRLKLLRKNQVKPSNYYGGIQGVFIALSSISFFISGFFVFSETSCFPYLESIDSIFSIDVFTLIGGGRFLERDICYCFMYFSALILSAFAYYRAGKAIKAARDADSYMTNWLAMKRVVECSQ